uniref:guanylate kinase n=1 Tax=Tetraselmis chuii TaxID=63592 RepID=A0A7S1X685_9CHLO|mmetsp:Transcript_32657/g.58460  ORF Transcript_32657/g.58460 Transcript_32657/m.58460 type:complete len:214 (+) Transcript_32657:317-958(+)|eukprot:CAMPEP_0177765548 /NCGR_PEP_ID=MMETSP0491_2-20121128/8051_1 /TAXON_ID=63592 /ORGANISM="Tetraselmis chuii, Strain PLY429" /LENGTH=213 /DNA_ID=CAMNT_0019281905 /DNA_START=677 /DNA_END=1318 /DNA_ORIENTATION=+
MDLTALEHELGCELSSQPQHEERPVVAVISGPSGVGKDAAIRALQAQRPDIHFVVTATSRAMRPGEVDGVDYIFVSKEKFEQWIANDEMLEHALVYGQYKGIPRAQVQGVLERGQDVVLRLDVQGAATLRRLVPDCISIFIAAESERALAERLVARSTELPDQLKTRVETARAEASQVKDFDYVVVNRSGKLEETVQRLAAIIDAEKSRVVNK